MVVYLQGAAVTLPRPALHVDRLAIGADTDDMIGLIRALMKAAACLRLYVDDVETWTGPVMGLPFATPEGVLMAPSGDVRVAIDSYLLPGPIVVADGSGVAAEVWSTVEVPRLRLYLKSWENVTLYFPPTRRLRA